MKKQPLVYCLFSVGTLLQIVLGVCCHAQELHFSQYYNAPLLINPANTGFDPSCDYRIGVNYRDQWASVINDPYKTISLWGDAQIFNDKFDYAWMGVGGMLYRDDAGSAGLRSNKGYVSLSFHQMLNEKSLLSVGFSGGWVRKDIEYTKLLFDNQWNNNFFDISKSSNEPITNYKVNYLDLNIGADYAYFANEDLYLNGGISLMHINRPSESFYNPDAVPNQTLPLRTNLFFNASWKINDNWILNPNMYISHVTGANEWLIGANADWNASGDGFTQLFLGLYYRNQDAVIPMVGYMIGKVAFTFNFDATVSKLSAADSRQGAYELSIVKKGLFKEKNKAIKCPMVAF